MMRGGHHVRMHVSLPCSSWSKMSRITAAGSEEAQRRRTQKQSESRGMLRKVISVITELKGPLFACTFEWPDGCDGFNHKMCPEMKKLELLLPVGAKCHGCAYGLVDPEGLPIEKTLENPFRLSRSEPNGQAMSRTCETHRFVFKPPSD